eukprot:scaffold176633_cov37-Prasinocladus_malaysianus.AAC.1
MFRLSASEPGGIRVRVPSSRRAEARDCYCQHSAIQHKHQAKESYERTTAHIWSCRGWPHDAFKRERNYVRTGKESEGLFGGSSSLALLYASGMAKNFRSKAEPSGGATGRKFGATAAAPEAASTGVPHVLKPSVGLMRIMYAKRDDMRTVVSFHRDYEHIVKRAKHLATFK